MRLAGVALLFFSGVTLAAQAPPRDGQRPALPSQPTVHRIGTATIRGRIHLKGSDDPVRHARIELRSAEGVFPALLTDADGRFVATSLPPGRFTVTVSKPGFMKSSATLTVAAGGAAEDVRPVNLALEKGGTISGIVLDEFGEPAPN